MTTHSPDRHHTGTRTAASALTSSHTHRRAVNTTPVLEVFPPTSATAATVTMVTVYALMAITIVFIVLHEVGVF